MEQLRSMNTNADLDLIERAYRYSEEKHRGQSRLSGEPYIIHPLEVAIILTQHKMDSTAIAAALLHDVVEDTDVTLEEMTALFGTEVAQLVDGVTKISSLRKRSKSRDQAETLRKMLMATINDPRVIIIKLADKTHNMRTVMFQPDHKQIQMSEEVIEIYAPLAGRLGMSKIRSELEDIAFRILHPEDYTNIKTRLAEQSGALELYIDTVRSTLHKKLGENGIPTKVIGRVKHCFSIYRKMQDQDKSFDEIFDIRAVRIITDEVSNCYAILGAVHTLWAPVPNRFKDYIAMPKSNMYQSLHTTVIGPENHFLEIQIRTHTMDVTAEMGIAAHWAYKEKGSFPKGGLQILADIHHWGDELTNTREFMSDLKMNLYQEEVFAFTPKGKIIKLPKGATPIDFAFAIHSEVGTKCVGAKINGKLSPLKTELTSGDIVEILTNAKGHPSETWLKFVKSSNARHRIHVWIRKHNTEENPEKKEDKKEIREEKEKKIKNAGISIPDQEVFRIRQLSKKNKTGVIVEGHSNVLIRISQCCQPIPGDLIIGFITRGRGITVHKQSCPALKRLVGEPERFVKILWADTSESTYPVKIAIHAIDRPNLLRDIADHFADMKTNIIRIDAEAEPGGEAVFKFVVEVKSLKHVEEIAAHLKKIKNISKVHKLNEKVILK